MCSPSLRLMTDRACHQGQILLGEAGLLLTVGALPPGPPPGTSPSSAQHCLYGSVCSTTEERSVCFSAETGGHQLQIDFRSDSLLCTLYGHVQNTHTGERVNTTIYFVTQK